MPFNEKRSIRTLFIDGDPAIWTLYTDMLKHSPRFDFEVTCVGGISPAGSQLTSSKWDLILMNLTLPNGKGIELVSKVRSFVPDTVLVILTELDDDQEAEAAIRATADEYLVRGRMSLRSLCERIGNAIVRKEAIKEIRSIAPVCSHVAELESVLKQSEERPNSPPYPRRAVETFVGKRPPAAVGEDSDKVVDTELETKIKK